MKKLTIAAILWTVASTALFRLMLPLHYMAEYPVIPIMLYLLSALCHAAEMAYSRIRPGSTVLVYLALKMLKLVLSVMMLLIYCLMTASGLKEFVLAFLVNYVVFLIVETSLLVTYRLNKQ